MALWNATRPSGWFMDSLSALAWMDFDKMFTPVVKPATIRIVLTITSSWC